MINFLKTILLTACFVYPASISFAQKPKPKHTPKPIAQTNVDLGTLRSNTYTTNFFELRFEFPMGWLVGDNVLEEQLNQIVQAEIKTKNPQAQQEANQAIKKVTFLLGGYKLLPGMPENASLRVAIEDLRTLPHIKTGKDYFALIINTFKAVQLPAGFKYSAVKNETIDNFPLDYIELRWAETRSECMQPSEKALPS